MEEPCKVLVLIQLSRQCQGVLVDVVVGVLEGRIRHSSFSLNAVKLLPFLVHHLQLVLVWVILALVFVLIHHIVDVGAPVLVTVVDLEFRLAFQVLAFVLHIVLIVIAVVVSVILETVVVLIFEFVVIITLLD